MDPARFLSGALLGALLSLLASAGPAAAGEPDEPTWVVLRLADDSILSGTLVAESADVVVVASGAHRVTLPRDRVTTLVSGRLDDDVAPTRPHRPLEEPSAESTPQEFRAHYEGHPVFETYKSRRLQLVDRKGRWLGPASLGFGRRDMRQYNDALFYAVVLGDPEYRLSYPEFLELAETQALRERYDRYVADARDRKIAGRALMLVAAGFAGTALVAGSVAFDQGDTAIGPAIVIPTLGTAITTFTIGAGVHAHGERRQRRLQDYRLEYIFDRSEAWKAADAYNSALRTELGLPDDARLDAPSVPVHRSRRIRERR